MPASYQNLKKIPESRAILQFATDTGSAVLQTCDKSKVIATDMLYGLQQVKNRNRKPA
jgi:hypothetical protein